MLSFAEQRKIWLITKLLTQNPQHLETTDLSKEGLDNELTKGLKDFLYVHGRTKASQ